MFDPKGEKNRVLFSYKIYTVFKKTKQVLTEIVNQRSFSLNTKLHYNQWTVLKQ